MSATTTTLTISWGAPKDNGSPILNYTVQRDDWWDDIDAQHISNGPTYSYVLPAPAPMRHDGQQQHWHAGVGRGVRTGTGVAQSVSFTLSDKDKLLPASEYSVRVRASNAAGASKWGGIAVVSTNQGGHCGNPADMKVAQQTKTTMKPTIQQCLIGCSLNRSPEDCAIACIQKKQGFSHACAACWGDEGVCTLHQCVKPCLAPKSTACAQCSQDKCFPACVQCSGVPMWAFPP